MRIAQGFSTKPRVERPRVENQQKAGGQPWRFYAFALHALHTQHAGSLQSVHLSILVLVRTRTVRYKYSQ